ncbi:FMRFamide receptor-like [Paramacrobiotus metropolitanus]|uniref:FMRFamide receptor-like n=1 Tax=Paramacrobiotus metropolitanus TaxID=2943436 RepID=UPI0024457378|nr:FMRFamide receptor-like [Paramacrobiotus metropolitanus]XP_055345986.1 FMRFamide receptor-like [Paramacrobiotus metropolitanus]
MRTFKICPPAGLWVGKNDDGGNDTFFSPEYGNHNFSRWCLMWDYNHPGTHLFWLDTIGYPILLALCTFGNVLNLLVFSCAERPKSSKNIYLAGIAVSNFIYMWSQMPLYLHNNYENVRNTESFRIFFWRSEGIWKFLINLFVTISDWVLIVFSFERMISVCSPGSYANRSDNGIRKSFFALTGVFLAASFYSLFDLIGYYWFYYHLSPDHGAVDRLPTSLQIWSHMQQLAIVCVPIGTYILVVIINLLVIMFSLVRRKRYRAALAISRDSLSGDLTRIAIASFLLYLLCILPMFDLDILSLLHAFHLYDMPLTSRMYQIWYPIALYILNVNYSVNFLIYLAVSPHFRRALSRIFFCKRFHEGSLTGRPILAFPDRSNSPDSGVFIRSGAFHSSIEDI